MTSEECRHSTITTHTAVEGDIRLWACADCRLRFYPACSICVDVGHRSGEHPPGPCIFDGCVSRDRHWHYGFPGGYTDPRDPDGPPIAFTTEPAPGVRDYNGALLTRDDV